MDAGGVVLSVVFFVIGLAVLAFVIRAGVRSAMRDQYTDPELEAFVLRMVEKARNDEGAPPKTQ